MYLPVYETWFERKNSSQPVDLNAFIPEKISQPIGIENQQFSFSAYEIFNRMLSEEITVEEAIRQIEIAGNAALLTAKNL